MFIICIQTDIQTGRQPERQTHGRMDRQPHTWGRDRNKDSGDRDNGRKRDRDKRHSKRKDGASVGDAGEDR